MLTKLWIATLLNCLFLPAAPGVFAQSDTIRVTHAATSYLLFGESVALVDIGLKGEYLAKIEGNCVFVKALHEKALPTTMLVKSGGEYFTACLQYQVAPSKALYDFRQRERLSTRVGAPAAVSAEVPSGIGMQKVRQRLVWLSKDTRGSTIRQVRNSGISLRLTHLFHDPEATYLKLVLENKSSLPYLLEYVGIERIEKRGKRFSVNNQDQQVVQPLLQELPGSIAPRKQQALLLALPLYALSKRGHLQLTIREKQGARVVTLLLPASLMNQAPFLPQKP